ncbi:MAG: WD40 repeat domain-containing protein, partial [Chloroflexi bacterium]|nr:WD40 repeat domain-containing protein [Chloroflexota bacterium]
ALSPDGRYLALAGPLTLTVYDLATMTELWQTDMRGLRLTDVIFSFDGAQVISSHQEASIGVVIRDTLTGQLERVVDRQDFGASSVSSEPDGPGLALSGANTPTLINSTTGAALWRGENSTFDVAFHPSGDQIAAIFSDGDAALFDATTGELTQKLRRFPFASGRLRWSQDGRYLTAEAILGSEIALWSFAPDGGNMLVGTFLGSAVAWLPDQNLMWVGLDAGSIVQRAPEQADVTPLGMNAGAGVRHLALSADGSILVAANETGRVQIWDANTRSLDGTIDTFYAPDLRTMDLSNDQIVAGTDTGQVITWPLDGPPQPIIREGHSVPVRDVRFSPDGSIIASLGWDGRVVLWPVNGLLPLEVITVDTVAERLRNAGANSFDIVGMMRTERISFMGWGPNNQSLWLATPSAVVYLDAAGGASILNAPSPISAMDTDLIQGVPSAVIGTSESETLFIVRPDPFERITEVPNDDDDEADYAVQFVRWTDDGRRVATLTERGLTIWSTQGGRLYNTDRPLRQPLLWIDDTIWGVDTSAGTPTITVIPLDQPVTDEAFSPEIVLSGHIDRVTDLMLSPQGGQILSASEDGTILVWTLPEIDAP